MDKALTISSLTVRFGGLLALDNVSMDVHQGELLCLIGPNGAGKTTMLKSITGMVRPQSVSISLDGQDITCLPTHMRARRGLAMTHQIVRPFASMNVLDNVLFAAGHSRVENALHALFSMGNRQEKAAAMSHLEQVGIADYAHADVRTLPLGILKRLEVARALSLSPKVLLLDEPLAGLNSREASLLADTVREIVNQDVTVVMIEHNLSEVLRVSDRLHVLDNGKNLAHGKPVEVMKLPEVRAAYLGE